MMLTLALSVLLYLNPPAVVVFLDAGAAITEPEHQAAEAACPYLTAQGVPLPVPFRLQGFRATGEGGAEIPDPMRVARGVLRHC